LEEERAFILASLRQLDEEEQLEKKRRLQVFNELENDYPSDPPAVKREEKSAEDEDELNSLLAKLVSE